MNQQYWLIKNAKKLQRKFNAKEDENIVASDNELDAKLELFKSVSDSTMNLSNIVEKYKDGLNQLSVEVSNLGTFLKDCGKSSASSSALMCNSGKVICYLGTQHFSATTSLTRTLQELNTFKRAVNDTKETILVMEKERTEYRSALTLMKQCSIDIDPDSGRGLEKFRTSQKYVKFAKQKFDKYSLACLQKIDLLAAARCNLFSYSLAAYQTNWTTLNKKNQEVMEAHIKLIEKEPRKHKFGILKELAQENEEVDKSDDSQNEANKLEMNDNDKDQRLFFGDEFKDKDPLGNTNDEKKLLDEKVDGNLNQIDKLIDCETDFDELMTSLNVLLPSQLLMDDTILNISSDIDLFESMVPSQGETNLLEANKSNATQLNKNSSKKTSDVSKWFNLFSELDPLNQQTEQMDASKNLYAA